MSKAAIGLVGLDPLSTLIAARLASDGWRVLAHDRDAARCAALASIRPRIDIAATLADIGIECTTVITALPTLDDLKDAVFGTADRAGFAADMAPGGLLIDMSPGSPAVPPRLQGALGARAIGVVDARVLVGGAEAAAAGRVEIALGGYPEFVDRAAALLSGFGRIHRTGRLGSARAAATVVCGTVAALRLAALKADALAEAAGLDGEMRHTLLDLARRASTTPPDPHAGPSSLAADLDAIARLARELGLVMDGRGAEAAATASASATE